MVVESGLLTKIKRFCSRTGMKPTRFGVECLNDPSLVIELEAGRELRRETRKKIESFLRAKQKKTDGRAQKK